MCLEEKTDAKKEEGRCSQTMKTTKEQKKDYTKYTTLNSD